MSTIFNTCDSIAKYERNTGANRFMSQITEATTPQKFEALRLQFPKFQLDHCNRATYTVLHRAVSNGNVPLIEHIVKQAPQLLEKGDAIGITPLKLATECRDYATTRSLLELGANVNVISKSGESILGEVATRAPHKVDLIKLLLQNGAKLNPEMQYDNKWLFLVDNDETSQNKDINERIQLLIELAIKEARKEIARERGEISQVVYELIPLPKVLCDIVAQSVVG